MDIHNQSALSPILRSVAQNLLVEQGMKLGNKLLQGKKVDEKELFTLAAIFVVYLIVQPDSRNVG